MVIPLCSILTDTPFISKYLDCMSLEAFHNITNFDGAYYHDYLIDPKEQGKIHNKSIRQILCLFPEAGCGPRGHRKMRYIAAGGCRIQMRLA